MPSEIHVDKSAAGHKTSVLDELPAAVPILEIVQNRTVAQQGYSDTSTQEALRVAARDTPDADDVEPAVGTLAEAPSVQRLVVLVSQAHSSRSDIVRKEGRSGT